MRPALSAIVLAGGASRRMGRDKRAIEVDGHPMLTTAIRLAAELADDVVISCRAEAAPNADLFDGLPVRLVFDSREGGPLAGLESSLAAVANDLALVLAVDMPAVTEQMLWQLVDAAVERPEAYGAVFGEGFDLAPFPAVLRRKSLVVISEQLSRASLRVVDAIGRLNLITLPRRRGTIVAGPMAFLNVNVPGDLAPADRNSRRENRIEEPLMDEESRMDLEKCLVVARESSGPTLGKPVSPTAEETTALLDFTRAVAHASERKDAPLAAYAMGIAMASLKPAERAAILSRATAAIDSAAGSAE
jgi:molybdopterin-guanine dinucleotide biosynthesis protein A